MGFLIINTSRMNSRTSYVGRQESIWIKGFLTLLIILGHDVVFTVPLRGYGVMSWLYTFHIQGFFILPFLYGISTEAYSVVRLKDTAVRFYWPYFLLTTVFAVGLGAATGFRNFTFERLLHLYVFCDGATIREMCGVQIFWFLPSMMSTMLLKELYYRNKVCVRIFLLVLSVVYIACDIYANVSYASFPAWNSIVANIPLGGGNAIQMLLLGVLLRRIYSLIDRHQCYMPAFVLSLICFGICSFVYAKYVALTIGTCGHNAIYVMLQNVTPLVFMPMLVSAVNIIKIRESGIISKIGGRSLHIYLVSPFIGYVIAFICQSLGIMYWWMGILVCPLIAACAYFISVFVIRGNFERLIFPRSAYSLRVSLGCRGKDKLS